MSPLGRVRALGARRLVARCLGTVLVVGIGSYAALVVVAYATFPGSNGGDYGRSAHPIADIPAELWFLLAVAEASWLLIGLGLVWRGTPSRPAAPAPDRPRRGGG